MAQLLLKTILVGAALAGACAPAWATDTIAISYVATTSGAPVLKASLEATLDGDRYAARFNGKTTGVTNMVSKYKIGLNAAGTVAKGKLLPSTFSKATSKKKKDKFANVTFKAGDTTLETHDGPQTETAAVAAAVKARAADPLTAILRFALAQGAEGAKPCSGTQRFYDGRDVGDLTLGFVEKQGDVYHCRLTYTSIAGRNVENNDAAPVTYGLWLTPVNVTTSKTPLYLPARLTGEYTGLSITVVATAIAVNGAEVPLALTD